MKGRLAYSYFSSPLGEMEICFDDDGIYHVKFLDENEKQAEPEKAPEFVERCNLQLNDFFEGKSFYFDLPLIVKATEFQERVWEELKKIHCGSVITYVQLAKKLGDANSVRAVATATGKNPFQIIVPCHRVIGTDENLTGYSGGLKRKQWILEHEQKFIGFNPTLF